MQQVGPTFEERARIRDAVFRELDGRRMLSRGRLDPDTEIALRTFVQAPFAIVAVAQMDGGRRLLARAASDGRNAGLVRQDGNLLVFAVVRPERPGPRTSDLV